MKVRFNTSIESKKKNLVKRFANLRKILGEDVTEGDIIEEALDVYGIEDRCLDAMNKIQQMIKKK